MIVIIIVTIARLRIKRGVAIVLLLLFILLLCLIVIIIIISQRFLRGYRGVQMDVQGLWFKASGFLKVGVPLGVI